MPKQNSCDMTEWVSSKLGDIFVLCNDKTKQLKSGEYGSTGLYPIIDQSERFICGYTDIASKVYKGNLPIVVFGDHTRHVKYVYFRFVAGADGTQLLIPSQKIDIRFFYYIVLYASNRIGNYGYDRHLKHLKEFNVSFSTDNKEQSKIAEILSTVDEAVDKTEALIQKYQRIKQGLMQDLLTKGIDEKGNIRSEKTHKFKNSPLGRIPEEWEVGTISNFASKEKNAIVDGPFGSNLKTEHYRESGRPVIQSGFVTSNQFIADKYLYVEESKFRSEKRSIVKGGDIVMAKIGAQCGKCAIMPIDHPHGILAGNSLKIKVSKNNSSQYLEALLHYYYDIGRLFLIISTTAQPAVSMSSLKNMLIPRPSEVEQHRIASILSKVDETIQKEQAYKQKLLSLKRGLMEDLLTGKVRVNSLISRIVNP